MRKKIKNKCKLQNKQIMNLKMKKKKEGHLQGQGSMYPRQGYHSWGGISSPSIKTQDAGQLLGLKGRA